MCFTYLNFPTIDKPDHVLRLLRDERDIDICNIYQPHYKGLIISYCITNICHVFIVGKFPYSASYFKIYHHINFCWHCDLECKSKLQIIVITKYKKILQQNISESMLYHIDGSAVKKIQLGFITAVIFHQHIHITHPKAQRWGWYLGCLLWVQNGICFLHAVFKQTQLICLLQYNRIFRELVELI